MKNPPFEYHRPTTMESAVLLLNELDDEVKVLAGGQSLLPIMALRLAHPNHIVDIGSIEGLDHITAETDGSVTIGALVRHGAAEASEILEAHAPLVHQAMPYVGHRAIRTRGTVCGSIVHADPAAEMPAVCLAAGADLVAQSVRGQRTIAASDFFHGYLETALEADEILTAVRLPATAPGTGTSVVEVSRRHGDYALVGLACSLTVNGHITSAALSFFGAGSVPVRISEAEQALIGQAPTDETFASVADIVSGAVEPSADIHGTANYRKHLAGVLTRRGLPHAFSRIGAMA
jgi:carbon-monoxide dehydrogenase medium subunit